MMSEEAIESNKLVQLFRPSGANKKFEKLPIKTSKEKEIEDSVRKMFDKSKELLAEKERRKGQNTEVDEQRNRVYASLREKFSRKKMEEKEEEERKCYAPPVSIFFFEIQKLNFKKN